MELNPRLIVRGILDDTNQSLEGTFADHDRLTDQPIASETLRRPHTAARHAVSHQRRVHFAQIWPRRPTSFGRDRHDVGRTHDDNAGVLGLTLVVQEEERPVDVDDHTAALLAVDFAHRVAVANLGAVPIGSHRVSSRSDLVGDLRRQNGTDRSVLVENAKRFAVNFDHTGDRSSTSLQVSTSDT